MKEGIFSMSEKEYHADPCPQPSLSSSIAKTLMNQSPLHAWFKHPRLNPAFKADEDQRFSLGRAAHSVILESNWDSIEVINPENFPAKNGSIPIGWTNQPIRAARDSALASGKTPILQTDADDIEQMEAASIKFIAQTELAEHFEKAKAELCLFWKEGDLWMRSRLDKVFVMEDLGQAIITDYKSTTNASPEAFGRIMSQLSYPLQSAFYRRGLRAVRPDLEKDPIFLFLAQENTEPYACSLHALSNMAVEMADHQLNRAIELWKWCMEKDTWNAYPPEVHYQAPPAWEVNKFLDQQETES